MNIVTSQKDKETAEERGFQTIMGRIELESERGMTYLNCYVPIPERAKKRLIELGYKITYPSRILFFDLYGITQISWG